jgi:hypothetical protein
MPSSSSPQASCPRNTRYLYLYGVGYTAQEACPEGTTGLSPGFQPWEPNTPLRRALKGRQIESTCNAEVGSKCGTWQLRTLILRNDGREIHLVSSRPFRANHSFWVFPGLKPWAESFSPFGAGPSGRFRDRKLVHIRTGTPRSQTRR